MENEAKFFSRCFLCERDFQYGPHVYKGKRSQLYEGLMFCNVCRNANRDGIAARHYIDRVKNYLFERGLSVPESDINGFLPMD